jgi:hypothetical protein
MFKAFEFCLPTNDAKVPACPEWLHEIKYDGYRLRLERNGDRVRLITRRLRLSPRRRQHPLSFFKCRLLDSGGPVDSFSWPSATHLAVGK